MIGIMVVLVVVIVKTLLVVVSGAGLGGSHWLATLALAGQALCFWYVLCIVVKLFDFFLISSGQQRVTDPRTGDWELEYVPWKEIALSILRHLLLLGGVTALMSLSDAHLWRVKLVLAAILFGIGWSWTLILQWPIIRNIPSDLSELPGK